MTVDFLIIEHRTLFSSILRYKIGTGVTRYRVGAKLSIFAFRWPTTPPKVVRYRCNSLTRRSGRYLYTATFESTKE